ncbi:MAG: electron transport complex subunit E [Firmicutes bacterium]|jgi:electron transport complex protein RnfE|nr:electron transport complex subunit E [Bacillota bacterium]
MSLGNRFIKGIWSENPVLRMALGLVPALGITHLAINGVIIGISTTIILITAVLVKILTAKVTNKDVSIYVDIACVAVFTTLLYRLMGVYQPEMLVQLGIYFPLIAVNGFVFQRLSQDVTPTVRLADALGMGIGYTAALTLIGIIREFIGLGQIFGVAVINGTLAPFSLAATVPGGFVIVGLLMALCNALSGKGGEINE